MYVIKPTVSSCKSTPSYNFCAKDIVFFAVIPSLVLASCCNVLVMNGGFDCLFFSFLETSSILNTLDNFLRISSASNSLCISTFLSLYFSKSAVKSLNLAVIV